MNNELIVQKVRQLIIPCNHAIQIGMTVMENNQWVDSDGYRNSVKSLSILEELKELIGFKEDEPSGALKQLKIFDNDI